MWRPVVLVMAAVMAAVLAASLVESAPRRSDPFDNFSPGFKARYLKRVNEGRVNKPQATSGPSTDAAGAAAAAEEATRAENLEFARKVFGKGSPENNPGAAPPREGARPFPGLPPPARPPPTMFGASHSPVASTREELELDPELREQLELINGKVTSRDSAGAIEMADQFVSQVSPMLDSPEGQKQAASALAAAHLAKLRALRNSNRLVEALVEAQTINDLSKRFPHVNTYTLRGQLDAAINELELEMVRRGPLGVLGARDAQEAKQAHKRLILLLHPDKNQGLSGESQAYLQSLFVKVREAFSAVQG